MASGLAFDEVIHDREVVHRKVPKNVDIVLEKAEVDPSGIVIVELSQASFIEQLPDFLHGAREEEGVVHHDLEILLTPEIDQFFSLRGIAGERLLDENVFAILQRGFRQRIMGPNWGHDGDGVNLRRRHNLRNVCSHMDSRISPLCALSGGRARLRDGEHLRILQTRKVPYDVWPPVAVSNHREIYDVPPPSENC